MTDTPKQKKSTDKLWDARPAQPYTHKTDIVKRIKAKKKGTLEEVKIGADEAMDLLDLNIRNRPFQISDTHRYTNDMLVGRWYNNGEPIIISDEWYLINGQKRLWSLVFANEKSALEDPKRKVYIEVDIKVGVKDSFRSTLDTGKNRSLADTLCDFGFNSDPFNMSAAIRTIWYIQEFGRVGSTLKKGFRMDNQSIADWTANKQNMGLVDKLLPKARDLHKQARFFTISAWTTIYYLLKRTDGEFADFFMEHLASGKDLVTSKIIDDNIYNLRQRLQNLYDRREFAAGASVDVRFRLVMVTWNACMDNRRLEKRIPIDMKVMEIEKPKRRGK